MVSKPSHLALEGVDAFADTPMARYSGLETVATDGIPAGRSRLRHDALDDVRACPAFGGASEVIDERNRPAGGELYRLGHPNRILGRARIETGVGDRVEPPE